MRAVRFGAVALGGALASAILAGSGAAAPRPVAASRCPSPDELSGLSRSIGTGPDNERRAYSYFGERFGRPASLDQRGNDADIAYSVSGTTIHVSLRRRAASGVVEIMCRESR